ncbi:MAG TPA: peptidase [Croceibacterium sp.]
MASDDSTGAGLSPASRAAPRGSGPARAARWARRTLFLVHRGLGVVLALVMAIWAISGITMMYVAFPDTSPEERLGGLQPLDLSGCCAAFTVPEGPLASASVEMLLGRPVLRIMTGQGPVALPLDGQALPEMGAGQAGAIAATHVRETFGTAPAVRVAPTEPDQWTVYGRFRQHAPLYKASFADPRGTELYVSGLTGEVVQDTSSRERFWNWLGAVPHWLYFTALRANQPLWYNLVVYTSLLGVFLTVTGIYVGVVMYGRGKKRWSPFRGIALWHHWTGLVFGLLTLTWVASGLFSMNPWGWFESQGPTEEIPNLAGREIAGADAMALVGALGAHPQPGVISAQVDVQQGRPWAILVRADGMRTRASLPDLVPAPPSAAELDAKGRIAKPATRIASARTIAEPDAYHYGHKGEPVLPAYRVIYANADETRLYFDPRTGELINFVDAETRAFRWWHLGLHRLDFPVLRSRPLWDIVTLPLLIGVSLLCLLGVWMGVRRVMRPRGPMRRGASRQGQPADRRRAARRQ